MLTLFVWLLLGALLGYGTYALLTWWEFGDHVGSAPLDPLLDRFIPDWEVAERHETAVYAPLDQTYTAIRGLDLEDSWVVRLIFRLRKLVMGGKEAIYRGPRTMVDRARAMGWGVLAEVPGRIVIMGAVTQPWKANPVFRPLPADDFIAFNEPGYAKIIWAIGAEPSGWNASTACTETRVKLTDPASRRRFRSYWAMVAPGVRLIRQVLVHRVRSEAETMSRLRPAPEPASAGSGRRPQSPRQELRAGG